MAVRKKRQMTPEQREADQKSQMGNGYGYDKLDQVRCQSGSPRPAHWTGWNDGG